MTTEIKFIHAQSQLYFVQFIRLHNKQISNARQIVACFNVKHFGPQRGIPEFTKFNAGQYASQ